MIFFLSDYLHLFHPNLKKTTKQILPFLHSFCEVVHSSDHRSSSACPRVPLIHTGQRGRPVPVLFTGLSANPAARLSYSFNIWWDGLCLLFLVRVHSVQLNFLVPLLKFCSLEKSLKSKTKTLNVKRPMVLQKRDKNKHALYSKLYLCVVFQHFDIWLLNHLAQFLKEFRNIK